MIGSYWQRDAAWCDRWHDSAIPRSVDFAILGGGLAGLTTAIRLRELHPGADILVLEAERVGYGASGRNAGFLSPLAAPVWLLGAERSPDQAWAAARINAEVHAAARWIAAHVPECELASSTLGMVAHGRLFESGIRELARACERVALAHRLASSRTRPGRLSFEMDAYMVHPYKLVRGLADHAVRAGVHIRERARARAIEAAPGGARVRVDESEVFARGVIVCTNAYTGALYTGERTRALVVHAFMLASDPLQTELVRDGDFTVEVDTAQAFHRMHAGRILYGGDDKIFAPAGDDFAVPERTRTSLLAQLRTGFPRIGNVGASAWAGKFHVTTNGLPIIQRSAMNPAVVWNVGYGGTGVALTLVCARLAAAVASSRFASDDDARFLSVIQDTRISVRDAARTIGRLLRGATRS